MGDSGDELAPGTVRIIVTAGDRYATTVVERHILDRHPEFTVSTVDALLQTLDGADRPRRGV